MSLNQQLREPRVLAFLTSRLFALMAFMAAALLVAGCASSPPPAVQESHSPSAAITAPDSGQYSRGPDGDRSRRGRAE